MYPIIRLSRGALVALFVVLICIVMLGTACDPYNPTALPPTPTRPPAEFANIYAGDLPGKAGVIGVVVTKTRARALICGVGDDWRTISGWLSEGTVTIAGDHYEVSVSHPTSGASISAALPIRGENTLTGNFKAANGKVYPFAAPILATPDQLAALLPEGIYRTTIDTPPSSTMLPTNVEIFAVVMDAGRGKACTFVAQGNTLLSRMQLMGMWQAGVSVFSLIDLKDKNGKVPVWYAPGRMGQIDRIALPTTTP